MERRSSARARSDSRFLEQPKKGGRELIPYRFTGSKTPREPLFFVWTSLYTYFFKRVLSTASHLFFKSSLHSHGAAREITSSEMSRRLRASRVCPPAWCATKESSSTRPPPPPPHIRTRAILRMYQWPLRTLRAKLHCGRTSGGDAIVPRAAAVCVTPPCHY